MAVLVDNGTGGWTTAASSGGGGFAPEDLVDTLTINSTMGPGMDTLPDLATLETGFIMIVTTNNPLQGGMVFAHALQSIAGNINLSIGAGETILLQNDGTSDWEIIGRSPSLYQEYLAEGGDLVTLPALNATPQTTCYRVIYNNTGSGLPVDIVGNGIDSIDGGAQQITVLYESIIFYHDGFQWLVYTKT